jgi:Rps23 Pro-64 3,4-dihydroxylase Tpa1-like proline 4-hydroxylase/predicted O-methyltransferase YrrM
MNNNSCYFLDLKDSKVLENWNLLEDCLKENFKSNHHYLLTSKLVSKELNAAIYAEIKSFRGIAKKRLSKNEVKSHFFPTSNLTKQVTDILNSQKFCDLLSSLLITEERIFPDEKLAGGGIHVSTKDGFLKSHLDFNYSPKDFRKRVLNLIIYFNPVWDDSWGGHFEAESSEPPFNLHVSPSNRQILFRTDKKMWHGVTPVNCDMPRVSLALYYYTKRDVLRTLLFGRMTCFKSHKKTFFAIPFLQHKLALTKNILSPAANFFMHDLKYLIKSLFILPFSFVLSRRRYSLSSHNLCSQELTILRQSSSTHPPSKQLLKLTSLLYSKYNEFAKNFNIISSTDPGSNWDKYPNLYSGEHYILLPLIASVVSAKNVVEIGTFQGCSAKALLKNSDVKVTSFDIIPWKDIQPTFLETADFESSRMVQHIDDLSEQQVFRKYSSVFLDADIIFLDGPKNYRFELEFLRIIFDFYRSAKRSTPVFLVMDDVKTSTMVDIWHSIPYPKIVLDEIGHWSGTGLVILDTKIA